MSLQEWHERFGHLNEKDLKNIIRKQKVDGIDIKADEALPVWETCVKGKETRKPFTRFYRTFRTRAYRRLWTHARELSLVQDIASLL
jgi:hypothetical protein